MRYESLIDFTDGNWDLFLTLVLHTPVGPYSIVVTAPETGQELTHTIEAAFNIPGSAHRPHTMTYPYQKGVFGDRPFEYVYVAFVDTLHFRWSAI